MNCPKCGKVCKILDTTSRIEGFPEQWYYCDCNIKEVADCGSTCFPGKVRE